MAKICVVGSGTWGTAISNVLADNGHEVVLWSFDPKEYEMLSSFHEHKTYLPGVILNSSISYSTDLEGSVTDKDILVIATPSFAVRSTVARLKSAYKDQLIVVISKGFEEDRLLCFSEVIEEELNTDKIVILSGPSHAEEVVKKMPTTLVSASKNQEYACMVQDVFMCSYLRIYTSNDIIGVQLGAALKNIISLCAGIIDGYGYGDNLKAALMTRGMAEIVRLGLAMGGKAETFYGLSGMGDLIVTCTSMHSRNRRAGILLGKGKTPEEAQKEVGMVVEGIIACESAYRLAQKYNVEMPIVNHAHAFLKGETDLETAMKNLMERDKKAE